MKIAQISPLAESVPPKLYGGTERIVSYLTEELVRQGHEVTLFASGDSQTAAELVAGASRSLRLAKVDDPAPYNVLQLEQVRERVDDFDVLHFHTDFAHFPLMRRTSAPSLTTTHGRLDFCGLPRLFQEFDDMPLVSISEHQRSCLCARWAATIYHGLPRDLYRNSRRGAGGYLAFLGRICPEKRPDRAIEIARRAGLPLKIAAKVDKMDQLYFEEVIKPLLSSSHVEFIGEIGEDKKEAFLSDAKALLFPIDWPEPFGLVMIESMACGTPVVAWSRGSAPEVIDDGVSGFLVRSVDEAVGAVERIDTLERDLVRRRFELRFTAELMARNYLRAYDALCERAPVGLVKPRTVAALAAAVRRI